MTQDSDSFPDGKMCRVLPVAAVDRPYSYLCPPHIKLQHGQIVEVPLRARHVPGVVIDGQGEDIEPARLRPILRAFTDVPPLAGSLVDFVMRLADWTLTPAGAAMGLVVRSRAALEPPRARRLVRVAARFAPESPVKWTAARRRVMNRLAALPGPAGRIAGPGRAAAWPRSALARAASVGPSVVDGLVRAGILETICMPPPGPERANPHAPRLHLTPGQERAARLLCAGMPGRHSVWLLDGVTGSGKTAVYFEAAAKALAAGRQVLILLPEIALTREFIDRFVARFAVRPAIWHSQESAARRDRIWHDCATGALDVVVGTRSALFLPLASPGLIIVDEEHDMSFKQSEGIVYHARDMAVLRGYMQNIPVILSSATPSVESRVNVEAHRYRHVVIERRASGVELPHIEAIDMRHAGALPGKWLAPRLVDAVRDTVARGAQALLFLNRRGFAPLTLCRSCGHRFSCPDCASWLVEHRFQQVLRCHLCDYCQPRPRQCPDCRATDSLVACGPGVERIAAEAGELFPDARLLTLSSDLLARTHDGPDAAHREISRIRDRQVDIVIGTQILAKGFHFPGLELVGVVDADLSLAHGDPRAAERSFQLITQVTGRAGREKTRGHALLQTHAPDHPVIMALAGGDRDSFYRREIAARRAAGLAPFSRMAMLHVASRNEGEARDYARHLARQAPDLPELRILGPAQPLVNMLRGYHRFRVLAIAPRRFDLQSTLRRWLASMPSRPRSLRLRVDIDPQNFL